jgi:hypothetical protein
MPQISSGTLRHWWRTQRAIAAHSPWLHECLTAAPGSQTSSRTARGGSDARVQG